MEKSLVKTAVTFVCVSVLYSLNILRVNADVAPLPGDPGRGFALWPVILIGAVVVIAIFLYKKFRS